ncbi:MerR family transcriptional regulator [Rosettibacter firmus]|uniref:MerR family transcriptional regulator n=1 Tax=Rosettibacter firmus TaxID=3111522 RepID=UPI00336C2CC2
MLNTLENDEPIFPISTAAKLLNISIHTLRMYEREGLIIPYKKESNQRLYSKSDIERLECIRKAINEFKISINGIKALYSLIPCWEIVKCSQKDRKNCKAYNNHSEPCWNYEHRKNICEKRDCRNCDVYKKYNQCGEIKELIKSISR